MISTLLSDASQMTGLRVIYFPAHLINVLETQFWKVGMGVMDGGIYGKMFVLEFAEQESDRPPVTFVLQYR